MMLIGSMCNKEFCIVYRTMETEQLVSLVGADSS